MGSRGAPCSCQSLLSSSGPSGSIFAQTCCLRDETTSELARASDSNVLQSLTPLLKKTRMASFFEALASLSASDHFAFHGMSWGTRSHKARSAAIFAAIMVPPENEVKSIPLCRVQRQRSRRPAIAGNTNSVRSEEHTSELQSHSFT